MPHLWHLSISTFVGTDPHEPLAGDENALAALAPIWRRWQEIDGWERGEAKEALALEKQWDAELRRFGLE